MADLSEQLWSVECDQGVYGLDVDEYGAAYIGCDDYTLQKISSDGNRAFKLSQDGFVNGIAIDGNNNLYIALSKTSSGENLRYYDAQGNQLCQNAPISDNLYTGIGTDGTNVFVTGTSLYKFKIVEEPNL